MFFAAGPVEQAVTNKTLDVHVSPDRERMVGYGNMDCVLRAIEGALKGRDYVATDRFTAADVYLGAQLGWGMMFGTIEKRPVFEDYVARVQDRPAYRRAEQIDVAAIPAPAAAS